VLRREIEAGVKKLEAALGESKVPEVLGSMFMRDKKADPPSVIAAYVRYMQLSQNFGPVERALIETFDLQWIQEVGLWALLTTQQDAALSPETHRFYSNLKFFQLHVPKILHLLDRESDNIQSKAVAGTESQFARLSVIVIEYDRLSTPERLILMLDGVQGLYEASAAVLGESSGDFCLLSCDSGSDKAFDFLGLAKIVECVKEVILSFWDKIVYYREDKTGKRIELIANSLPILERITTMKDEGRLEPERAEILRRQVIQSVTKFAEAGVTIPEIERFTTFSPRQLMRPEPKLLVGPEMRPTEAEKAERLAAQANQEPADPELQKYLERAARDYLERRRQDAAQGQGRDPWQAAGDDSGPEYGAERE
jgi:hypothetical protein